MRKAKLTLGLVAGLLTCTALASCDPLTYSPEGYLLTYTSSDGTTRHYTTDDLFDKVSYTSANASTFFDAIYKIIVKNYFTPGQPGESSLADLKINAENSVLGVEREAQKTADDAGTSYSDEIDKQYDNYGVNDRDELFEHFLYEEELSEFEKQFNKKYIDELKTGYTDSTKSKKSDLIDEGYLENQVPYHVRHILVSTDASSSTDYTTNTISAKNASTLYTVANKLAESKDSFGKIASNYSGDGSKDKFGDLGIMDKSTSFVNEFKLGIYAYEGIYGEYKGSNGLNAASNVSVWNEIDYEEKTVAQASGNTIASHYQTVTGETTAIGTIPYGAFVRINEVRETISDSTSPINDGSEIYYPRNIYFNKYFNKHSVSVVTPNSTVYDDVTSGTPVENFTGVYNATYAAMPGFKVVPGFDVNGDGTVDDDDKILTTTDALGNIKPILVVRAGNNEGNSYQGVHFITIERSGMVTDAPTGGVDAATYYNTKYPGQDGYPVDNSGNYVKTYVNYLDEEKIDMKTRAEEVETKVKSFNTNLSKHIYEFYRDAQQIEVNNAQVDKTINDWIKIQYISDKKTQQEDWDKAWVSYFNTLEVERSERKNLLSETCAYQYTSSDAKNETGLWAKGGVCSNEK